MRYRFLNLDDKSHLKAWALLIMEYQEFGGYLEDTRENIEIPRPTTEELNADGLVICKALHELGLTTRDQVDEWARSYSLLLNIEYFPLSVSEEVQNAARAVLHILNKKYRS